MSKLFELIGYAYANYRHCKKTNNHNEDEFLAHSVMLIEDLIRIGVVDSHDERIVTPILEEIKQYLNT